MALTLLSSNDGQWTGYLLEPIPEAQAVIWDAEVAQYSADESRPIKNLELLTDVLDEFDPSEQIELVVAGELDDQLLLVNSIEARDLVRPFIFITPDAVRLQNKPQGRTTKREISKAQGGSGVGAQGLHAQQNPSFLRLSSFDGQAILVWLHPGGFAGWQSSELIRQKNALHGSGTAFINPYTFVPLPDHVDRAAPNSHHGDPRLLIGWVDLTYELLTDLVLPCDWQPDESQPQPITLPGSGIRGAVRALHEVIAGGCMRVVNLDYLPVHRETTADANPRRQVLATVTKVDDNHQLTEIQLTDEPIWVPFTSLTCPVELRSGLRFDLATPPLAQRKSTPGGRLESTAPLTINPNPNGAWLLHLADIGARADDPYWLPIARLTNTTVAITPDIRQEFTDACLRAKGVNGTLAPTAPSWGTARWPSELVHSQHDGRIGLRRKVDGRLSEGDSAWWVVGEQRLKMALMWRKHGTGNVGQRIGAVEQHPDTSVRPCADPESLCPTCAVFGAAGPGSNDDKEGQGDGSHLAYGGHVRFLPAVSTKPVQANCALLAPLREPRTSSGGFYLETTASARELRGERGLLKSVWGSALDRPKLRRVAGRKFYWHGQQPGQPNTGAATPRQFQRNADIDDPPRWLVPAGTQFAQRVTFDGLDHRQLSTLLCALDPQELADAPSAPKSKGRLALHFGGGKPLGFGSVICVSKTVNAQPAADRYSGDNEASEASTICNAELAGITADAPWFTALLHALDTEFVDADRIHYPFDPEKASFQQGMTNDAFLESFAFFALYNGGHVRTKDKRHFFYPMVSLPRAADEIQYIDPKPEESR